MNRRSPLRDVGLLGLSGISVCLDAVPIVRETTLGWFALYNRQERNHQFDVRTERDGTVVHESSHHLRGWVHEDESESIPHSVLELTWDEAPEDYSVVLPPRLIQLMVFVHGHDRLQMPFSRQFIHAGNLRPSWGTTSEDG